jgi:hypothetical protein
VIADDIVRGHHGNNSCGAIATQVAASLDLTLDCFQ